MKLAPPAPPSASRPEIRLPDTLEFMQLLWALVHALERTSKRMAGDVGVTGPQRLVLRVVGLAPRLSAGELATILHVHPSTLTGILERLASQRLLARVPHPNDRRRAVLTLTPAGAKINTVRDGTAEAAVSDALRGLTRAERDVAARVIKRLRDHLDRGVAAAAKPAMRR